MNWEVAHFTFIVKLLAALIAGLVIGLEREFKGKSAGIKTNGLVALGSAIFVLASLEFHGEDFVDITRVLSQVVTGIGFLGAGVILQQREKVKGLTTAATIWCSAAIGCLAALGMFPELLITTLLVVTVNLLFGFIDSKIESRNRKKP
ncbi:MgtC/SapB family protein [Robertkochia flava]|uniref:MgtC/SapB family protein n=1 Tax=Robertkochia flava TaxID=3447986 RepID=UPI001CCB791C|nr:MgtC/SapB family protein [Robertkochia marina]